MASQAYKWFWPFTKAQLPVETGTSPTELQRQEEEVEKMVCVYLWIHDTVWKGTELLMRILGTPKGRRSDMMCCTWGSHWILKLQLAWSVAGLSIYCQQFAHFSFFHLYLKTEACFILSWNTKYWEAGVCLRYIFTLWLMKDKSGPSSCYFSKKYSLLHLQLESKLRWLEPLLSLLMAGPAEGSSLLMVLLLWRRRACVSHAWIALLFMMPLQYQPFHHLLLTHLQPHHSPTFLWCSLKIIHSLHGGWLSQKNVLQISRVTYISLFNILAFFQ